MGEDSGVWEYRIMRVGTNNLGNLQVMLNQMGSTGWEVVALAAADKTLGLNEYAAIMKRTMAPLPPPDDRAAGWKNDPLGRHQYRWWDGLHWESTVNDGGTNAIDWPVRT